MLSAIQNKAQKHEFTLWCKVQVLVLPPKQSLPCGLKGSINKNKVMKIQLKYSSLSLN